MEQQTKIRKITINDGGDTYWKMRYGNGDTLILKSDADGMQEFCRTFVRFETVVVKLTPEQSELELQKEIDANWVRLKGQQNAAHSFTEGSEVPQTKTPTIDEQIEFTRQSLLRVGESPVMTAILENLIAIKRWNETSAYHNVNVVKVIEDLLYCATKLPLALSYEQRSRYRSAIQNAEAAIGMINVFKQERHAPSKEVEYEAYYDNPTIKGWVPVAKERITDLEGGMKAGIIRERKPQLEKKSDYQILFDLLQSIECPQAFWNDRDGRMIREPQEELIEEAKQLLIRMRDREVEAEKKVVDVADPKVKDQFGYLDLIRRAFPTGLVKEVTNFDDVSEGWEIILPDKLKKIEFMQLMDDRMKIQIRICDLTASNWQTLFRDALTPDDNWEPDTEFIYKLLKNWSSLYGK